MNLRDLPSSLVRSAGFGCALAIAALSISAGAQAPFFNRNIPQECHDRMVTLRNAGHSILCVAFPPAGGNRWSVVTDQSFFNRGIPQECHDRMVALHNAGHHILCVAFPPGGGNSWTIVTDRGFLNRNVPQECHNQMVAFQNAGHHILCVAYPPAGGNSWSILTDRSFFNRNVPQECHDRMRTFAQSGELPRWAAFPRAGGNRWTILTDRSLFNRNVPSEAHQVMTGFLSSPGAVQCVAYDADGDGFSIVARIPQVEITSATSHIENVTADTLRVTGENLDLVTSASFGRNRITRTDSSDPTLAYFTVQSRTQLLFHPPQGLGAGTYALRLSSASSTSNAANITLSANSQSKILVAPRVRPGAPFAVHAAAGGTSAAQAWLAISPSSTPSVLRGVVSFDIGAGFTQLFLLEPSAPVGSSSNAARFDLQAPPVASRQTLHLQALLFTRSLPLPVTDVGSTTFF